MKTGFWLIVSAVYFLLSYSGACGKDLDIIFPKGENIEIGQEYLPVIGSYIGDDKELKLSVNDSVLSTVKLEKGKIFTDKVKLNSGLNKLTIVNGADTLVINVSYAEENKSGGKDFKKILIHPPVVDNECSECHNKEENDKYPSVDNSKAVCFNCHDSFEKVKFIHGPVGTGSCSACHEPHGSTESKFLREDKDKICYMCHEEEAIKTGHLANLKESNKEECSYCHNPHGGKDKYFLKETKK